MMDSGHNPHDPIHALRALYASIVSICNKLIPKIINEPHYLLMMATIFALGLFTCIMGIFFVLIWPIDSFSVEHFGQFSDFLNGIWNPLFGSITIFGLFLSLYFQVMQNVALKKQLNDSAQEQIEQRKRESFFNATSFLIQIIDRLNLDNEGKEKAFSAWLMRLHHECDKTVIEHIDFGFEPRDISWYAAKIAENATEIYRTNNKILDDSSLAGLKEYYSGIHNIIQIREVKLRLCGDFWESASENTRDNIIRTCCFRCFEKTQYLFGPFFKTIMRILEIAKNDKGITSLFKAQLTAQQMISLQANAICGFCNEEHDLLVRQAELTNDSLMINNPYVKHLGEMYSAKRYTNKLSN